MNFHEAILCSTSLQDIDTVGNTLAYWARTLNAVTKRYPPVGFFTKKLGETYLTITPTSSGLARTPRLSLAAVVDLIGCKMAIFLFLEVVSPDQYLRQHESSHNYHYKHQSEC